MIEKKEDILDMNKIGGSLAHLNEFGLKQLVRELQLKLYQYEHPAKFQKRECECNCCQNHPRLEKECHQAVHQPQRDEVEDKIYHIVMGWSKQDDLILQLRELVQIAREK